MKLPAISTIEFTNACNFTCSYCQRYHEDGKRKIGNLKLELVESMISRGDFDNTLYTEFQQNGEPTIHPLFEDLASLIKSTVPYVGLSTNGTFHKFKHKTGVEFALRTYCDCITLSLHPETTQYDVDYVVDVLQGSKAKLRIQTLNAEMYKIKLDGLRERGIFLDNYDIREFGKVYEPKACLDPAASVTVQWDGDVVACCNVVGKQRVYGSLYDRPMSQIWHEAKKTMFNYCKTCRTPSPYAKRLNFLAETLNS